MGSLEEREEEIHRAADMADISLQAQKDTLVITSRDLISGNCKFLMSYYQLFSNISFFLAKG